MTDSPARPAAGALSRLLPALLLAGAIVHGALYFEKGLRDDGYIEFRYAQNLASGKGFVFNAGERVDGSGGPAWVAILAGLRLLGFPPEIASRVLGIASAGACLLTSMGLAEALGGRRGALAAGLLLAADPAVAVHANTGLNTLPCSALVAGALSLASRAAARGGPTPILAFLLAGLAPAFRIEALLLTAVFLVAEILRGRPARARSALAVALAAGPFLWRWAYFGDPLPNTYYCKKADLSYDLAEGLAYVKGWILGPHGALLALGLLGAFPLRSPLAAARLGALGTVLGFLAFSLWAGGDFVEGYRFLVPAVPVLAALAGVGLLRLSPAGGRDARRFLPPLAAVGLAAWLLSTGTGLRRSAEFAHVWEQRWNAVGRALRERLSPDCSVALAAIGAIGYRSGLPVVDMLGLIDRHIARRPAAPMPGLKAHQKFDGGYVLSRRPDVVILANTITFPIGDPDGEIRPLPWERDLFDHPAFARDYERVVFPVRGGFPLVCFRRRDSPCGR